MQVYHLRWDDGDSESTNSGGEIKDRVKSLNNEIYFSGDVRTASINALVDEFSKVIDRQHSAATSHVIASDAPTIAVTLYIDSSGGVISAAFKFIDFVRGLKRTQKLYLTTVCIGCVASAATLMSLVGDTRYITPHAVFMIHELWTSSWGTYTHAASRMKYIQALHERIVNYYLETVPTLTRMQVEEFLLKETWLSATECAALGFAEVLQ